VIKWLKERSNDALMTGIRIEELDTAFSYAKMYQILIGPPKI